MQKPKILDADFFARKTLAVARDLIGMYLVTTEGGRSRAFRITETEAYVGPHDLASHSSKGRTKRTEVMFGHPGTFYIYLIYGMYWMLNVVTEQHGFPSAVLIRGVEGFSGPGRVTKALGITNSIQAAPASKKTGIWFEDRGDAKPKIVRTARIGVDYAGPVWSKKPYRFVIKGSSD